MIDSTRPDPVRRRRDRPSREGGPAPRASGRWDRVAVAGSEEASAPPSTGQEEARPDHASGQGPATAADQEAQTSAPGPVQQVINRLDALTDHENLEVGDILDAFGATAFVPVLMVLALIVVSPLSGIPFLPTFFGLMIAMVSTQMLLNWPRIWLPGVLRRRTLSGARLHGALNWLRGLADWLDRTARRRFRLLVSTPLDALVKASCILCGLSMPFLELVPFSSSILGAAVIAFCTGLLTRDGLFALLGWGLMTIAAMVPLAVYGGLIRAAAAAVPAG